ncbi:MAG: 30S ribosomal protein S4 [Parcubacteria group bacterium GW2011_GWB1_37_13]|uniref:Small ribosomal subunit protein uS4 n=1 Tax=Candidatus Yanofskybacteria bacterium GW2011_GWC2_37_9 TaxID=1619028 RepID=A0A0G0HXC3_9BACT|nr:MAG: 30S ribosomal protein S4 [Parcubacteria group bacterium GW2011_GWB1_37_13]KKQ46942.1 MAG: 30S ribosomal protein S4 [Candidatus Yanofskybacteria bacterium GW2011_GWC2_37_9]
MYDKCQTSKFKVASSKGGLLGARHPKALSEYGTQLIEKQKIRFSYGITERQLSNYVKKAFLVKGVGTTEKLFEELEFRLDNAVYRMGLSNSRRAARQMVSHGHFIVNDKKVTIPSYELRSGDIVKIRQESKGKKIFSNITEKMKDYNPPVWINFDVNNMEGKILDKPKNIESFFDLNAVLEFYSR